MKNDRAVSILKMAAGNFLSDINRDVEIEFSDDELFGHGSMEYKDGKALIKVGMPEQPKSFFRQNRNMSDHEFTKISITLFHELGHLSRLLSKDTSEELRISELSKYGNDTYYRHNWHRLLHEIDAEYTGISSTWSLLEDHFPQDADRLMFDHLTDRAAHTVYMVDLPEHGFRSRAHVDMLFDQAYDRSYRELPPGFLRSDDDTARLFTNGCGTLDPGWAPFL